jgi:hypothetical protein
MPTERSGLVVHGLAPAKRGMRGIAGRAKGQQPANSGIVVNNFKFKLTDDTARALSESNASLFRHEVCCTCHEVANRTSVHPGVTLLRLSSALPYQMQHDRKSEEHAPMCQIIAKRRVGRSVQARREENQMTDSPIGSPHIRAFQTSAVLVGEEVDPAADPANPPKYQAG